MLPRRSRLPRNGFSAVRTIPRMHGTFLSLSFGKTPVATGYAVIVPKKAVKKSVARHLLKRRLRSLITPYIAAGFICLVTARAGADMRTFAELHEELFSLMQRIKR